MVPNEIFLLALGYLLGSIPFGKIVARTQGVNIQTKGSGNIGFANVRRVLGWRAGIITLSADIFKGALPTYMAYAVAGSTAAFVTGLCAVFGHVFPLWLRFRGGKGIATGLGVVAVISPIAAALGVIAYLLGCKIWGQSSKGSLLGLLVTASSGIIIQPGIWWQFFILILVALWTLRKNIAGTVPNYDI